MTRREYQCPVCAFRIVRHTILAGLLIALAVDRHDWRVHEVAARG